VEDNDGSGVTLSVSTDNGVSSVIANFSTNNQLTFINSLGGTIQFRNSSLQNIFFTVPADAILAQNVDTGGSLLGFTVTTPAKDATLISLALLYKEHRGIA
jgi:hypothetical protein